MSLAVFLDRDGVINVRPTRKRYVTAPDELQVLPRVALAIRRLNEAGCTVIVITCQRGISLGLYSEEELRSIHERLRQLLAGEGARLDAIYHCPHDDGDGCSCRKPGTGLFLQAQSDFPSVDFRHSVVIGDSVRDLVPGERLGCRTVLVSEGNDNGIEKELADRGVVPDFRVSSLWDAVTQYVLPVCIPQGPAVGEGRPRS